MGPWGDLGGLEGGFWGYPRGIPRPFSPQTLFSPDPFHPLRPMDPMGPGRAGGGRAGRRVGFCHFGEGAHEERFHLF